MNAAQAAAIPALGLSRIAGHAAAIAAEVERLTHHGLPAGEESSERLRQAMEEMTGMSRLLAETRAEVVGLSPPPTELGDVLDAVVNDTEQAALEILQQAELAQAAAQRLLKAGGAMWPAVATDLAAVDAAATAIVMACAFQDITGQRVRKVLSTLRQVEARVATLVTLMGISDEESSAGARPVQADRAEAHLLNGPSSAAQGGLGQNAVDDLFG